MWPVNFFDKIGLFFVNWFNRAMRFNTYTFNGISILRSVGWFSEERVLIADIRTWEVTMEMGFDIVDINLNDGTDLQWIDYKNDLINILKRELPDAERVNRDKHD